jgi:hypothetical protein
LKLACVENVVKDVVIMHCHAKMIKTARVPFVIRVTQAFLSVYEIPVLANVIIKTILNAFQNVAEMNVLSVVVIVVGMVLSVVHCGVEVV